MNYEYDYTEMETTKCMINPKFVSIAIILLIFSINILSIVALCINSYFFEKNICESSNLWLYILISITYNLFLLKLQISKVNNLSIILNRDLNINIVTIIFKFAFIIWALILFTDNCISKLRSTLLYSVSCITFLYDLSVLFISFLNIYILYSNKEESNLPLKLDNNDDNDTKQTNWNRDDVVTLQL